MLQDAYHRLATKNREYEPLPPEKRFEWEAYYAADQKELFRQLQSLGVID